MTRVGHPARLLPSVLTHSLDVLTQTSDAAEILRDVRADMDARLSSLKKARFARDRRQTYADLKELRKEFRQREQKCVADILRGSRVVLATLHGAGGRNLFGEQFDVVVIDEANQALEASCWVPLLAAKKVVFAGDHMQLPPTVKSARVNKTATPQDANLPKASLERTMLDRLYSLYGNTIMRMLTTQYRMHESIMRFPSDELYHSRLIAAEHVGKRLLLDLRPGVADTPDTTEPVVFIDTQGGLFPERAESDEDGDDGSKKKPRLVGADSKSNDMEALLAKAHVKQLVEAGIGPEDIAVITPYNAQLALLAPLKDLFPGIELGSVDGFQGREKEAVVVSLVRSNDDGEVGFLSERRRLNGELDPAETGGIELTMG